MREVAILTMTMVMLSAIGWLHEHHFVLRPTGPIPAVNVP
jgi:hypothetical protein